MNLHNQMKSALKIAVFGSDGDHCTDNAKKIAYEVGKILAKNNVIVFTGGGSGVMEYVSKGVSENGGIVIGILPSDKIEDGNFYSSIIIPTGIGFARSQVLVNSVDGGIAIEGGLGTREEAGIMYWLKKPLIAIATTGGTAEEIANKQLDKRNHPKILSADNAKEAVSILLDKIKN